MNPIGLNKNKSTIFILPIVFSNSKYTDILNETFKNAYIADFDHPEYDEKITIVKKDKVERHDFPEEFITDYIKIISGLYRQTSDKYKQIVLSFWECDEESKLYEILHSDKEIAEEVLPPFKLSDEIYNIGVPL